MARGSITRRNLLTASAALAATPATARTYRSEMPWKPGAADAPDIVSPGPYTFFSPAEVEFVDAAVARLIPADDLGPGAKEAAVTFFIDRQLGGEYGRAERWYMLGPWRTGSATQGYQSRLTPGQLYTTAIKAIDAHLISAGARKRFAELSTAQQDDALHQMEEGKLELPNVSSRAFFELLLQNTIEGFFSDPVHGGNRDMVSWKLIGFPGARYDYRDYVNRHGERFTLPPVGIAGRPDWTPRS